MKLIVESTGSAAAERPAWIGNDKLIFAWNQDTATEQLWIVNINGGNPVRFIDDETRDYYSPTYSAELAMVAFEVLDVEFQGSNIDAMYLDKSIRTRLVSQATAGDARFPTWGPQGTAIGYMMPSSSGVLFVMQSLTSDRPPSVAGQPHEDVNLGLNVQVSCVTWHPATERVAFNRIPPNAQTGTEIYYYDLDAKQLVHLTDEDTPDGQNDENPSWSPDGHFIVYSSFHSADFRRELYVVSAQTKASARITTTGNDEADPAWSPDGARIAYVSDGDLYVLLLNQALLPQE